MNRLSLRNRLREAYLDDTAAPYLWGDELLNQLIEEAQQEAVIRSRFLTGKMNEAIVAGEGEYLLPDNVIGIERVKPDGLRPLSRTSIEELDETGRWEDRSGTPEYYCFEPKPFGGDGVLTLYPRPTGDSSMSLRFMRLPEPMADDDDEPDLPVHLHLYLLDWAAYRAYTLRDSDANNEGRAAKHEAAFTLVFGERHDAKALKQRNDYRPHRVRGNRDYF